ncbi:MAG TPA: hypothetical protein VFH94_07885 [Streptomyces sp.]|nr:hypothetical protein [Streptomyces sp.]
MVEVSVTASIQVRGGPTLSLGEPLEPESYAFASIELAAPDERQAMLLPDGGKVILLGLSVRFDDGGEPDETAKITITPVNGAAKGDEFEVAGSLMIANEGALSALVAGGPRSLTLKNAGSDPVVVDILSCRI